MDKSWTSNKNRLSTKFINGLKNFITLSRDHLNDENKIRCPCVMCMNLYFHDLETVERHIFIKLFYTHYVKWVHHGENIVDESDGEDDANDFDDLEDVDDLDDVDDAEESDNNYTSDDDMIPAIEDLTQQDPTKSSFANFGDSTHRKEKGQKFHNLFAEVEKELYPGYNKDAENCHICGHERYKFKGTKGKKIPHKKMHYFPITPRLQRLFMSRHTSSDMRCHKEERVDTEGVLRHPADAAVWKDFDKQYPDFAKEPRNIRLGFATDGFNPFGDLSNSYSMWPVILMPYNMPPWICMKREFLMMSLLIPGRRAPGKDIDVYLQPLIEELKELWEKGVQTFDVVDKTYFIMRAAILWTINDFSAYGTVSGYST
ncbi:uncharacterized protein LOC133814397 [Humulus lupulus]|uniref:uncharacterized protein LOC133814397 n=1 Tax=Humulus lupulus TaxID=3486 RepID=UPI002B402A88|nr:uncharacterized protein LOC133814397 [Humulus lupulus]